MRRGLLAWSPQEIAKSEFDRRLAVLRSRFDQAGVDVLLVYTNFARPAAISYLTNVVLFWSEAMLVVPRTGDTTLVVGLPKRDMTVIRPTGCFDELVCDPDARTALVTVLTEQGLLGQRIAILDADSVPAPFAGAIEAAGGSLMTVDDILDTGNDDGSSAALQVKAADIARNALGASSIALDRAASLVAMVELNARLAGAEEVQVLIAPDLARDKGLRRIEGPEGLGERFAICVSVAYKGHWVRIGRTISRQAAPQSWSMAQAAIPAIADGLSAGTDATAQIEQALGRLQAGQIDSWALEGQAGGSPLALLAHDKQALRGTTEGQLIVFSAWLDLPDGPYFAAATARVGQGLLAA